MLATLVVLGPAPLAAQAFPRCGMDSLATYNCGSFYTGTVSLTSELRGASTRQTLSIVATITRGSVRCRVNAGEGNDFEGPGMLAVEHAAMGTAGGGFSISVWCPESVDDRPRRGSSPQIQVMQQRTADYGSLEGRDEHEHPDADAANGLSGRETIIWSLRRSG